LRINDQFHLALLDTPRRIRESFVNVPRLEIRTCAKDLFAGTASREQTDHSDDAAIDRSECGIIDSR
jgi:hypothetical protein